MNPAPSPSLNPAASLKDHLRVFLKPALPGPVLDLACGDGNNGIFLASKGVAVLCWDRSPQALQRARELARAHGVNVDFKQVELEQRGVNPLPGDAYGGILVFRYLHRPLIPCIRKALKEGGVLLYETFTVDQPKFGKPHNPDFLLKRGELRAWFDDWEVLAHFEGIEETPRRAVTRILCRKPLRGP